MNNQISQLDEFGVNPLTTPNMTTSPVNNFTASNTILLFNANSGQAGYIQNAISTLSFPYPIRISSIKFSSYITNAYYLESNSYFQFYLGGSVVLTINADLRAYEVNGGTYTLASPVVADSVYRKIGDNSAWRADGGDANSVGMNGCCFNGLALI